MSFALPQAIEPIQQQAKVCACRAPLAVQSQHRPQHSQASITRLGQVASEQVQCNTGVVQPGAPSHLKAGQSVLCMSLCCQCMLRRN